MQKQNMYASETDFEVSFGYQCNNYVDSSWTVPDVTDIRSGSNICKDKSFSCLCGAALSANATLANTNICNGLIGAEILPSWDSPNSFRKVPSSPNFAKLEILSSMSNLSCSPSSPEEDSFLFKGMSAPTRNESFLAATEVQVAGGAAGEDRVQAVCSEENGWLFCGIYDGFNGRDAADFLGGTFYETILFHTSSLDWESAKCGPVPDSAASFQCQVLDSLQRALCQAENDYLHMVEQEMDDRPDLVSVGSCVLVGLLHGTDLYTLNVGDSRAVLATYEENSLSGRVKLKAVQLTESHTVDNTTERSRLVKEHPDDPSIIYGGKVKGKLKVTRAFGVGYLKKKKLNDALIGILRVRNLVSPPYISIDPAVNVHRISKLDQFIIYASDGLFDFFSNEEAVNLVHGFILRNPNGDPAKYLLEILVSRAADSAGFSMEELMNIPAGRRRKYHDDVTVIVILLASKQRTSKASTRG